MKQLRWIWILAAAAVLLTVLFIVVDRKSKEKEAKARIGEAKQLFQIDPEDVTEIELNNEEGRTLFTWKDNSWQVIEGEQFNVNVYAVNALCNYFCNLESLKTVAFDCKDTAVYGFADPITIKLYTTDTDKEHPYILYVGDATPTYDAYYAMLDGSDDVYTIDYNSGTVFCSNRNSLKDLYMFHVSSSLVNYYKLEKDDKTVLEFRRSSDDHLWKMIQPAQFQLSNAEMNDLTDVIIRVKLKGYIEDNPDDLAQYGLDHPHTKIWLEGNNGETELKEEIWFGDTISSNENETQIYGYYANSRQVFSINKAEISFTDEKLTSLMMPYCAEPDIENLQKVEIDMGDVYDLHETLYLDYAQNQYSLGDTDITALKDDEIMQLYQAFYRSIASLSFSEIDLESKPDPDEEPAIKVVYTELDGKTLTLDLVPKDKTNYYLVKDGTYSGLVVRLHNLTGAGGITDRYKMLTDKLP